MKACRFSPVEGKIAPALPKETRRGKKKGANLARTL